MEIAVGRQPIFDRNRKIIAYELLFRRPGDHQARIVDGDQATAQVLNSLTEIGLDRIAGREPVFVNCTRQVLAGSPVLPPERCVLEVLENIQVDDDVVSNVRRLRTLGYRVALDDFVYDPSWDPLLPLADFIKVDIRLHTPAQLKESAARLTRYKAVMLAEKVESEEELRLCDALGFKLFQGYFLRRPETMSGRRVLLSRSSVVEVLGALTNPMAGLGRIEKSLAGDAALTYRLLRLANSGLVPVRRRIGSIPQAIEAVGTDLLLRWATLLILTGIEDSPKGYLDVALQRARACEIVAQRTGSCAPEFAYLSGLFSVLDSMLRVAMDEILPTLPLASEVIEALAGGRGPIGRILSAVRALESGETLPERNPAGAGEVTEAYWEGVVYAREMMSRLAV